MTVALHAWRHPRADGAAGRCIGHTDLAVDPRRAKRLAHRIRAFARQQRLPAIVVTSALARSRDVGRWLARWGWLHRVDAALNELDFGGWDGLAWSAVPCAQIDAWCQDFVAYRPGGGESVGGLLARVRAFDPGPARIVVTHGGWLSAALWLVGDAAAMSDPTPACWPPAPAHAQRVERGPWPLGVGGNGGRQSGAPGGSAAITLISKSKPESQVTPTPVTLG